MILSFRSKKKNMKHLQKINTFALDTSSPEAARQSLNDLLAYLARWLYRHILSSDTMIGKCLLFLLMKKIHLHFAKIQNRR